VTECNRQTLTFSSVSRRKISADFDGGRHGPAASPRLSDQITGSRPGHETRLAIAVITRLSLSLRRITGLSPGRKLRTRRTHRAR
jgi:hypothetical protein